MNLHPEPPAQSTDKTSDASETPRRVGNGIPSLDTAPLPIPDHKLIRRIGKGSYGEVWLARNALGTWRAVKIVRRSAFDADRPYEREFTGIQRFEPISRSHESQLNILQVGRVEDGFYYVMELADDMGRGQEIEEATYKPRDLRSELHLHGRLPVADCLRLGLALTTALEHLHKHGLVHRDIKPSNIVFVNGIPKLADIGLVAEAERTMSFVGTEGFVPPEGPGTAQADIYSLGKVLYELSTGHDRHQFPELPTELEALPDGDQLGELNEVLLRACQRDPAQRYQTAAEMHVDLALLDSGRSVVHLRGMERRLRLIQRAGAVVSAFALLVAAGWWWQAHQTSIVRGLVAEKSLLAQEKTKLADSNQRLADENRKRIVRLAVANGVSRMEQGDPAGALLWFVNALGEVTNTPEESIHRIRIQQALNQIPRPLQVLPPETPSWLASWSPDGKRIATTAFHGRTAVWDVESGAPLWNPITLPFNQEWLVQFTSDGRKFWVQGQSTVDATGTREYDVPMDSLSLIETETGKVLFTVSGPKWEHLRFSPKDRWFAIVDRDHAIHLHSAADGGEVAQLRGHTNQVLFLDFNPNADQLASTGADGSVLLWQLPSGQLAGPPLHFDRPLRAVRFSPGGEGLQLVLPETAGATNLVVELWDPATGKMSGQTAKLAGTKCHVFQFLGPGGERLFLATESANGVFASRTGERLLAPLLIEQSGPTVYSFSSDERFVAFGGQKGLIELWNLETRQQICSARLGGRDWADFNFSADGSKILGVRDDGVAVQIEVFSPRAIEVHRLSTPIGAGGHDARRWLSDDRRKFLLQRNGSFSVVDLDQLTDWKVPQPDVPFSAAAWAAIDPSGKQFAIHYRPKETAHPQFVELWREAGEEWNRLQIQVPEGVSSQIGFSRDGTQMITPAETEVLQFWNTSNGTLERSTSRLGDGIIFGDGIHRFAVVGPFQAEVQNFSNRTQVALSIPTERGGMHVAGVAVSPSGDCIALESGGTSEERFTFTYLMSTASGQLLAPVLEHGGPLHYAEFSPDGRRLLTTGLTPYVRVWDARTGEQLVQLDLGTQPIRAAQWSLDGRFIVARSDEKAVRVWDAATGEAVTPILSFADQVRYAILGQQNRLIVFSQPDLISVWELKECSLPVHVLGDYARYISGRYLNANGALAEIKPKQLAELGHSLRQRAPHLFQ